MSSFDLMATMKRYAYEMLKNPNDSLGCARRAFVNDDISAAQVADWWPTNPYVLEFRAQLLAEFGEDHFLPTRADIARELFSIGTSAACEAKDRINALDKLAHLLNYVEKPSSVTVNTGETNNRVMLVRDHGTDHDWEKRAKEQQAKLINGTSRKI